MRRQGHWTYKYLFKNRHESEIEVSWVYQSCQSINENYWARTLWGKRTEGRKMTMETQHRENDRTASVCSRERYKQTCSHPKWETALRDAATGVRGLTAQGFCPKVYPEQCLCSEVEGASEGLMNILLMRPRPVARISSHLKTLLLRPKFVVNRGSRSPKGPFFQERKYQIPTCMTDVERKTEQHQKGLLKGSAHTLSPLQTFAGTSQAPTVYQHEKERMHKLILRGGGEWRNRKMYKWKEWERLRDEGRKIANKLVWRKDSKGEKEKGLQSQKQGDTDTKSLQSVQNSPAATLLICYHSN